MNLTDFIKDLPIIKRFFVHSKPFVYVALGDSTVEGIGASHVSKTYTSIIYKALKNSYRRVEFYNLGKAGAQIQDVHDIQLDRALDVNPHLITISIGANDIFKRKGVKHFSKQLDTLLTILSDNTDATIVINTLPDFSHVPSIPAILKTYCTVQGKRFNKVIEQHALKHSVILADLYTHTKLLGKTYPELIADDGLHPSDIGYAIWAHTILVKLEDILKKKTGVSIDTETILPTDTVSVPNS